MIAIDSSREATYVSAEVEIGRQTGSPLHCRIVQPLAVPWARVLIIHGYGEHGGRYAALMRFLAGGGVASEAVDLRGHGLSPGRRGFVTRWEEYFEDVEAFLHREGRVAAASAPTFILGHSHGGLLAAALAERGLLAGHSIAGCILSSPYLATLQHVPSYKRVVGRIANHIIPWLRVPTGLRAQWITGDAAMREEDRRDPLMNRIATPRWFFSVRVAQARTLREAGAFKLPLLCLIGESDIIADPKRVADFYAAAGSPDKSLYTYPAGVHELLRDFTREKASADVLAWIRARVAPA